MKSATIQPAPSPLGNASSTQTAPPTIEPSIATTISSASFLWLIGAIVLLFFADGRHTMPLATWLAPACLLHFVRAQPRVRGLALAYLVLVVMRGISYHGMIPIPGIFYYIFMVISGLSAVMPYLADRLVTPRLLRDPRLSPAARTFLSMVVFPVVLVTTQFIYAHGPMGSWGSIAYTQAGNLPLTQLLSVTGLWGIVFLIGSFAAVANHALDRHPSSRPALRPAAIFAAIFAAVMFGGEARLVLLPPASTTVRVASLSPAQNPVDINALLPQVLGGTASASTTTQWNRATLATQDDLFARSEREASAGAKIIFWSETAASVLKPQEPALLARGSALASRYHLYLGMTLATWTPRAPRPLENKFVMIGPDGQIAWQYLKARPTPGPEMAASLQSDGKLRSIDTPYGRLVAAICYDTDFPRLMAQAAALKADIVLSPAQDWLAIDPRHTEIASFRAVEEGFSLVRQADRGFSAAYDYQGRPLAQMDHYHTGGDLTLVSLVPVRGVRTVYSLLGDWLAWACVAATFLLLYLGLRKQPLAFQS